VKIFGRILIVLLVPCVLLGCQVMAGVAGVLDGMVSIGTNLPMRASNIVTVLNNTECYDFDVMVNGCLVASKLKPGQALTIPIRGSTSERVTANVVVIAKNEDGSLAGARDNTFYAGGSYLYGYGSSDAGGRAETWILTSDDFRQRK